MLRPAIALPIVLLLAAGGAAAQAAPPPSAPHGPVTVTTDNETPVLYDDDEGGNASGDDPAIWVHPDDTEASIVIVTAKEGGLRVYDLDDQELQSLPATPAPQPDAVDGRYNNVDIAYGLEIADEAIDVAVVSDRFNDTLRFFWIDPDGAAADTPLTEITAPGQPFLFQPDRAGVDSEQTAYGLAVYQPRRGAPYAVVTQEGTSAVATARIVVTGDGVGFADVHHLVVPAEFRLPDGSTWVPCEEPGVLPQLEGVSVDQANGTVYAAQEDVGLWRIKLPLGSAAPRLVDRTTDFGIHDVFDPESEECVPADPDDEGYGGDWLTADAEGVVVYYGHGARGYVIVSSQGDDTFVVYARQGTNKVIGSFRIDGVDGVDGVNGSDGLAVTNRAVGTYDTGLLVSHDEPETGPGIDDERDATNFSYVSWGAIADALALDVDTRAANDPRFDG
jgi:3-phytase